jgi:quinoprotein glucose dehydrogenase
VASAIWSMRTWRQIVALPVALPMAAAAGMLGAATSGAQRAPAMAPFTTSAGEWPSYTGDTRGSRYSPLGQIAAGNFSSLEVAWRYKTDSLGPRPEFKLEGTPLMVGGVLYATGGTGRAVIALDAETGAQLWVHKEDEGERGAAAVRPLSGRGLAYWGSGRDARILYVTPGYRLIALDAKTGNVIPAFGTNGYVDLKTDIDQEILPDLITGEIGFQGAPVVGRDVVIIGAAFREGTAPKSYRNNKGYVRGFDVRTGKRLWTFHTIPKKGEPGYETWLNGSAEYTGNTGVWTQLTVDEELGLVYLPVESPTGDYYGGHRPGNDLYGESLVCLDLRTGLKKWHYQIVHHPIWDFDLSAAPILADIVVAGKPVKAVAEPTKQGILYVFDRVTGKPVWPIVERAVPASDVPGERASPTQPMPTMPTPFTRQRVTENDLIDFTPELHQRALDIFAKYRSGPIFTPPSEQGTITMPGAIGGAGWGSASFDPDTRTLYVKGTDNPALYRIRKGVPNDTIGYEYTVDLNGSSLGVTADPDSASGSDHVPPATLPLIKPPYGTLTAIDLDSGKRRWHVTLGDTPSIRNHPLLKGVALPPLGVAGAPGGTVTRGGVIFATGGGDVLYALDTRDGKVLWQHALRAGRGYANPITYRTANGTQFVVIASGGGEDAELVAFSLGGRR